MRLDELFSRKSGVMVWTKAGGRLSYDRGLNGGDMYSAPVANRLVTRKCDAQEA